MNTKWILLADDDLEDQEMLIEVMKQLEDSISITAVSDGRQAVAKLAALDENELPSLVILDYKMPYMNAGEVLETLAGNPRYTALPKIVWSSSRRADDMRRCLDAGACSYFEKPATTRELRSIAEKMLNCRRNEEIYTGK
jgi:CheY-like chemotaxis protein